MEQPRVIVLHGMARTAFSMRRLARALDEEGFVPINLNYPSRKHAIEELARLLQPVIEEAVPREAPLHLVSHSMGGLVGRVLMALLPEHRWSNAVFLAPPHQGSQLARKMIEHPMSRPFYRWFYGPAGHEMALDLPAVPVPTCPFGVIAGTRQRSLSNPISWLSRHILDEQSDGTVIVEETQLDTMTDYAEIDVDHTTIMNRSEVHRMVLHFLRHKRFPPHTS